MDTKKQNFINILNEEFFSNNTLMESLNKKYDNMDEVISFWNIFKTGKSNGEITENGLKILQYMQQNNEKYNNIFSAKNIGEGLFLSSRSISGSMRKLVTDEYVHKIGNNPVCYSLTEQGKNINIQ